MQSRPDMITGSACAWMGIGRSQPAFFMISSTFWLSPAWYHVRIGRGTSLPRVFIPSSDLRSSFASSCDRRRPPPSAAGRPHLSQEALGCRHTSAPRRGR